MIRFIKNFVTTALLVALCSGYNYALGSNDDDIFKMETFNNGVLRYTGPMSNEVTDVPFSALRNPTKGTFGLTKFGGCSKCLVITTDVERFFKVGFGCINEGKAVFLISPRQVIEEQLEGSAAPFAPIMVEWKTPVGLFWRAGSNANLSQYNYLTSASLASISENSLYINWARSRDGTEFGNLSSLLIGSSIMGLECLKYFRVFFNAR